MQIVALTPPLRPLIAERFDRAISAWLEFATGWSASGTLDGTPPLRIIQSDLSDPRAPLPYVSFRRVSVETFGRDQRTDTEVITSADLTVTASSPGDPATIVLNPLRLSYTLQAGEDETDGRDALLALVNASVEPVTAVAVGVDGLTLTPDVYGQLVELRAVEGVTIDATTTAYAKHTVGPRGYRYRVQFHGLSDVLEANYADPTEWVEAMITALGDRDVLELFRSFGVSHYGPRPTPTRATVRSGARLELRVFFDVRFSTTADLARPLPDSETVATVTTPTITLTTE